MAVVAVAVADVTDVGAALVLVRAEASSPWLEAVGTAMVSKGSVVDADVARATKGGALVKQKASMCNCSPACPAKARFHYPVSRRSLPTTA